jgi:phosphatidylinositol alpha-1,6-mannosyltransferase
MSGSLLLTYDFPPMSGGIARAMGELARHAESGSLMVSTGRVEACEEFDHGCTARVDRLAGPSERLRTVPGLIRWARRADQLVRESRPDFIWAGNLRPAGPVARWIGARHGIPYGLFVYGLDVSLIGLRASRPFRRPSVRRLLRDTAGTIAISGWTAERYRELALQMSLPETAGRVRVVPLGVDASRFRPGLGTDRVRARLGGPAERKWLLTVARLVPHKGIDAGLKALADLRAEGIDAGYIIAGEGPARADLVRMAEQLGMTEFVRWYGFVPDPDLPALYGAADVYLGLSRQDGVEVEGFGLSLVEAQACGLPVLAGASGGTADAVAAGVGGLLVPPTSRSEIRQALLSLLRDPARARAMGAAGREWVERERSWTKVLRQVAAAAAAFTSAGPRAAPAGR